MGREASRVFIAILKPSPSGPMRWVFGTRTSSKVRPMVSEAF